MLTCVALLLVIILLAKKEEKLCMGIAVLSGLAAASLMGNVTGLSVTGLLITLVLLGQCVLNGFLRDRLW